MPAGSKVPEPVPPPDGAHHLQAGPQLRRRRRPRSAAPPPLPGASISLPARCCRQRAPAAAAHAGRASRPVLHCDEMASVGPARQVLDADRNGIGRASRLFSHCAAVEPARHRRSSTAVCDSPDCAALPHTPTAHMRVVLPDAFPAAFLFFDQKMAAHAGRSSMRTAAGAWTGASSASRYASWCLQALVW